MKVVIFAGGRGTRLSEETLVRPKPMVEIGGKPILWHIMKIYSSYGFNEFIICLGYKGHLIKDFFFHYDLHMSNVTFDFKADTTQIHRGSKEPWKITCVDTGLDTMTGGRLLRLKPYLEKEKSFLVTYGDGVGNINIPDLIKTHKKSGTDATVTAVQPPGRFGSIVSDQKGKVLSFTEKPNGDIGSINGGFFVFNKSIFSRLKSDETILEQDPLKSLAKEGKLSSYTHSGFWHPMDTLRDKEYLESLWASGKAPWKIWK